MGFGNVINKLKVYLFLILSFMAPVCHSTDGDSLPIISLNKEYSQVGHFCFKIKNMADFFKNYANAFRIWTLSHFQLNCSHIVLKLKVILVKIPLKLYYRTQNNDKNFKNLLVVKNLK